MKKALTTIIGICLLSWLIAGQTQAADANIGRKITFTKYPAMKLGYLTAMFARGGMGPSVENAVAFIDYASEKGYSWIEIRDADGI